MSKATDIVSREILDLLYEQGLNSDWDSCQVAYERLLNALDNKNEQIEKTITKLEARGLVKINTSFWDGKWTSIEITEKGVEAFESLIDETEFNLDKVGRDLLVILHAQYERGIDVLFSSDEVSIERFQDVLDYPPRYIERTLKTYEAKGFVDLSTSFWNGELTGAKITEKGIEYFESLPDEPVKTIISEPTSTHQTIHIERVYGSVGQTAKGDIYNVTKFNTSMENARKLLLSYNNIDDDIKNLIIKHLDIIENEAKQNNPSKTRIQKSWEWLKRYTPDFIIQILAEVIGGLLLKAV